MDNDIIAEAIPKPYDIPPPNGEGNHKSVEEIRVRCPFCNALLDLSEAMRQAILALANAAASL